MAPIKMSPSITGMLSPTKLDAISNASVNELEVSSLVGESVSYTHQTLPPIYSV